MRAVAAAAFWWILLLFLWLLFVGAFSKEALYAGAMAAALAVGLGALLGRQGLYRYRLDYRLVLRAGALPWYLVRDFALIVLALLRGRPGGALVEYALPTKGGDQAAAGRRALVGALGSVAPNSYPVDVDAERGVVLMHVLDSDRAKGEPL
ncbi:MAG: Na+/H+ ion antiporter subunit [Gaiellaceae bacterium]|nr:Na+/H+ ion antiporter subunit [Gaiellaceae bacterium]